MEAARTALGANRLAPSRRQSADCGKYGEKTCWGGVLLPRRSIEPGPVRSISRQMTLLYDDSDNPDRPITMLACVRTMLLTNKNKHRYSSYTLQAVARCAGQVRARAWAARPAKLPIATLPAACSDPAKRVLADNLLELHRPTSKCTQPGGAMRSASLACRYLSLS